MASHWPQRGQGGSRAGHSAGAALPMGTLGARTQPLQERIQVWRGNGVGSSSCTFILKEKAVGFLPSNEQIVPVVTTDRMTAG